MALSLPLTDRISQSSKKSVDFRTLEAKFGDGYGQTVPNGTNSRFETWNLSFDNLTTADRTTMWTFLNSAGRSTAWTWTPPGDSSAKLFKVTSAIDETFSAGNVYTISFTCEQYFGV